MDEAVFQEIVMTTAALSNAQRLSSVAYGVLLWFLAAMIVRYIGPMGAFVGNALWITYALVIPGTVPFVILGQILMGLDKAQVASSIMIITATALLLDGIAFNFFRSLYGSEPAIIMAGAALILWGAGVGLVLGMVMGASAPDTKA
jgi:hypothetical protein